MTIWAIADLHLAVSDPDKDMGLINPAWKGYAERIADNWQRQVQADDLVLIPGDITWALKPDQARIDLNWIDALPGTKVLIKGNHDYWWTSLGKVRQIAPPSLHFLQHTPFNWNGFTITGTRLWDTEEFNFSKYIEVMENPRATKAAPPEKLETQKIFERELKRLELGLQTLDPNAHTRIAMTHYPPISAELKHSRAAELLEEYKVDICLFGHLHNLRSGVEMFGTRAGVRYHLTSADYLNFTPLKLVD